MHKLKEAVRKLETSSGSEFQVPGVVVGVVEGETKDGKPLVRWPGCAISRSVEFVWMERTPKWSACKGARAVLGFEGGDESKALLLGLLDPPSHMECVSESSGSESDVVQPLKPKVVRIESEQELILECGRAKIALRADGRVTILGGYVLSRSKGVNKIKGGSVQIN